MLHRRNKRDIDKVELKRVIRGGGDDTKQENESEGEGTLENSKSIFSCVLAGKKEKTMNSGGNCL